MKFNYLYIGLLSVLGCVFTPIYHAQANESESAPAPLSDQQIVELHEEEKADKEAKNQEKIAREGDYNELLINKKKEVYYRMLRAERTISFQNCLINGNGAATEKLCYAENGGKALDQPETATKKAVNGSEFVKRDIDAEIRFQNNRKSGPNGKVFTAYYKCLSYGSEGAFLGEPETSIAAIKNNIAAFSEKNEACKDLAVKATTGRLHDAELFLDIPVVQSIDQDGELDVNDSCPKGNLIDADGKCQQKSKAKLQCPGQSIVQFGNKGLEHCVNK